ncbi:MAG: DUF2254 domain-containing protein [Armatimonadota bacterium]
MLGIPERIRFLLNRLRQQLWVKPLIAGVLSIIAALIARAADLTTLGLIVPEISADSVYDLLTVMASSMLVIATFGVASMVSAYASASDTASPRAFPLVVADDSSQRAISVFLGAFIFSIVGLIALRNQYFGVAGRFALFIFTIIAFGAVVSTFVGWMDNIARLGRIINTVGKVETATADALERRREAPALHGVPVNADPDPLPGASVFAESVGYVQRIDVAALQSSAQEMNGRIRAAVLPGAFVTPQNVLASVEIPSEMSDDLDYGGIVSAFKIGSEREFTDDPRYGLTVLSQIAGRALSPGINDPGTAIDVIGTLVRLFVIWGSPDNDDSNSGVEYDRVEVPELSTRGMFDDAFTAISRDGSDSVEVVTRLMEALSSLAGTGDLSMRDAAIHHAQRAVAYAERELPLSQEIDGVRKMARNVRNADRGNSQDGD